MLKKISAAAAIAVCAAFPTAAYASGLTAAADGVINAGERVADSAFDMGRDILSGFTGDDTTADGADVDDDTDNNPGDTTPDDNDTNPGDGTTPGDDTTTGDDTDPDDNTTSGDNTTTDPDDDTASGDNSDNDSDDNSGGLVTDENDNEANSPNTGVTLGYTAAAAVLAAMGVMATAIRRRDD